MKKSIFLSIALLGCLLTLTNCSSPTEFSPPPPTPTDPLEGGTIENPIIKAMPGMTWREYYITTEGYNNTFFLIDHGLLEGTRVAEFISSEGKSSKQTIQGPSPMFHFGTPHSSFNEKTEVNRLCLQRQIDEKYQEIIFYIDTDDTMSHEITDPSETAPDWIQDIETE